MVTAITMSATLIFLWYGTPLFTQKFKSAYTTIFDLDLENFEFTAAKAVSILTVELGLFIAFLFLLVIALTVIVNMIANKGFLFSMSRVKFDFNRLNPVEGIKRMFSLKSIIDLIKKVLKVIILLALSTWIIGYNINAAFLIPSCGTSCFTGFFSVLNGLLILISIVVFLAFGFADVPIQSLLFLRQQRMSKSEAKRDSKEEEGSPETKKYQRSLRQKLVASPGRQGIEQANLFIAGDASVVGVRFVPGETPIPIIVGKGRGDRFFEILAHAKDAGRPIYQDDDLAEGLYAKHEPGQPLREIFFAPIIRALQTTRLV
jgi:type III secretion protein U